MRANNHLANNEKGLPQRRSIRLQGYDYSQAGLYFITICCQDKTCRFGQIENGVMNLNGLGQIAQQQWMKLSDRFPNFELDIFQIMPNHVHAIINLSSAAINIKNVKNPTIINNPSDLNDLNSAVEVGIRASRAGAGPAPTVANIVGAYKSLVANECLELFKLNNKKMGKLWQRNYFEHIIRNQESYHNISVYIMNNPSTWINDNFYQE